MKKLKKNRCPIYKTKNVVAEYCDTCIHRGKCELYKGLLFREFFAGKGKD